MRDHLGNEETASLKPSRRSPVEISRRTWPIIGRSARPSDYYYVKKRGLVNSRFGLSSFAAFGIDWDVDFPSHLLDNEVTDLSLAFLVYWTPWNILDCLQSA